MLASQGYQAVWVAEGGRNGVAILAKGRAPIPVRFELPGDSTDRQARYVEAAVEGRLIASLYVPNGGTVPGDKYDYKLRWMDRLLSHARELLKHDVPVVLAGDFNVAPEPRDIYETASYDDSALVDPICRRKFADLVDLGFSDSVRDVFGGQTVYTFWDYRRRRFERNAGLRLDHVLLNDRAAADLSQTGVEVPERGRDNASDHTPVWVEIG